MKRHRFGKPIKVEKYKNLQEFLEYENKFHESMQVVLK